MTIVGKILVFINLLFSLAVGGLVLVVYMTRVNYADTLKKEQASHKVDIANQKAYEEEYKAQVKLRQDEEARYKADHERVANLLKDQQKVNSDQGEALNEEKNRADKADALVKAAESEVAKRQQDVEKLRVTLKEEMDKTIKLVKENNDLRERTTAAEIQARTVLEINKRIENEMQTLARDNARMKTNLGAPTTTTASRTGKNPPPEQIEGLITTTDPSGLFKISLGSDAGLVRGHTMEVFRVDRQNPLRSKYLGTVRIIDVRSNEAVAQPVGKMLDSIRVGDEVASRILGG